ncbi:MAG: cupin domain-containing protein [Bryobacterales bacterium]|nr:cupin domain-containing protein [Bryobacterales bacterium]
MPRFRAALPGLLAFFAAFAVSSLWSVRAQQNSNFTGTVTRVEEGSEGNIAHFRFAPGARTKWHSHERGQIILVEQGVARTQVKGGPVVELHAGDTIYAPPGVVHWHGAAPDKECIQYNVTRGMVTWFDEVPEKDYTAAPKK